MELQLFETEDGSHSIFVPALNERYHSFHGAIAEAKHVYIQNGLDYFEDEKQLKILEIGFGTGLNAYLTLLNSKSKNQEIHYTSLEPFPLEEKIYTQLNYPEILVKTDAEKLFFQILHSSEWNNPQKITTGFTLLKLNKSVMDFETSEKFNLIYFDAFAPEIQPEMWTKEVFEKLFLYMTPSAALLTYCAKGSVKRTLKEVGFNVENLSGPAGKREMTRSYKP
ncbi:MAG: tRNA (5-methylaminomethyl-2-thiouridine)(34)-methyltransferase MnmD [Bacteroidia bacterium]